MLYMYVSSPGFILSTCISFFILLRLFIFFYTFIFDLSISLPICFVYVFPEFFMVTCYSDLILLFYYVRLFMIYVTVMWRKIIDQLHALTRLQLQTNNSVLLCSRFSECPPYRGGSVLIVLLSVPQWSWMNVEFLRNDIKRGKLIARRKFYLTVTLSVKNSTSNDLPIWNGLSGSKYEISPTPPSSNYGSGKINQL